MTCWELNTQRLISTTEFEEFYTDLEYINRNLLEADGAQSISIYKTKFHKSFIYFTRVFIHTVRTETLDRLFEFVDNCEEKISQNRANKNQH